MTKKAIVSQETELVVQIYEMSPVRQNGILTSQNMPMEYRIPYVKPQDVGHYINSQMSVVMDQS